MWHPDGLLVGLGDQRGVVSLWDAMVRLFRELVFSNFREHQSGARAMVLDAHQGVGGVAALAFNENGYMVATAGRHVVVSRIVVID